MSKIKTKYLVAVLLVSFFSLTIFWDYWKFWGILFFGVWIFLSATPLCERYLIYLRFILDDLFNRSIIVNATVYASYGLIRHENLGDDLNWFLIKKLSLKKVSLLNFSIVNKKPFCNRDNYLIIGSTITFLANKNTVIWGAGAIDDNSPLKVVPKKVCAVRGPLTREYLLKNKVNCPAIYGDPAMLIKFFYKPQVEKKYKLGIIPHYVDFFSDKFKNLKKDSDVLFIKMRNYKSVESVINEIMSCEKILSSSLHGLIISETYGVPNMWVNVSDKIRGGSFKYLDYYGSIGICNVKPYMFSGVETKEELISLFDNYKKGSINLEPLIKAAPFKLKFEL